MSKCTAAAGAETLIRPKAIQHPYQPQTASFAQASAQGFDSVTKHYTNASAATAQRPSEQHCTSHGNGRNPTDHTELDSAARQLFGEPLSRAQLDTLFQQEQQESTKSFRNRWNYNVRQDKPEPGKWDYKPVD